MNDQLDRQTFHLISQVEDISILTYTHLVDLVQQEIEDSGYLPDGTYQIDPRNGERVLYNSARARRPHDNRPISDPAEMTSGVIRKCVICHGETTRSIDVADLSEGFTFINKNLYPVYMPAPSSNATHQDALRERWSESAAHGLHLLQWTSSIHDCDWHNMPHADRFVVMARLAALEKMLLTTSAGRMPETTKFGGRTGCYGYASIIKNVGHLVGGSLVHGHQQIAFGNVMPRRCLENWRFQHEKGSPFSSYMLRENPVELTVCDYATAILLVPFYMRRPYDMLLLVKDTSKRYLHDLSADEIADVADGWGDALRLIHTVMAQIGRELAYNVVTHNGPSPGLYFEFLPYTQETGGLEHLGLSLCQADPTVAADQLRKILASG